MILPQSRAVIMEATSYSLDRIPVAKSECINHHNSTRRASLVFRRAVWQFEY
jgi:hypothetical protein